MRPDPQPPPFFLLEASLLEDTLNHLAQHPYREVVELIDRLRALQPFMALPDQPGAVDQREPGEAQLGGEVISPGS